MKRCVTRRYTRELDQPIEWIGLVGLPGSSEEEKEKWLQEAVDRVHREQCRKLELLKKELGLRTGPFGDFPLAMWLAGDTVRAGLASSSARPGKIRKRVKSTPCARLSG